MKAEASAKIVGEDADVVFAGDLLFLVSGLDLDLANIAMKVRLGLNLSTSLRIAAEERNVKSAICISLRLQEHDGWIENAMSNVARTHHDARLDQTSRQATRIMSLKRSNQV